MCNMTRCIIYYIEQCNIMIIMKLKWDVRFLQIRFDFFKIDF